jgi:hypothetical protein
MSTPLRAVYRGGATSYVGNFGYQLLAGTGFKPLEYDTPIINEEDEPIVLGPVPFLWLSYNKNNSSFLPFGFQESKIELDRFCDSYHCLIWGDGVSFFLQIVKRRPDGTIIWQKNYGNGVFSIPGGLGVGLVINTGYDSSLDTLYVSLAGTAGTYFLAVDTYGSIKFSEFIVNPPDFSRIYLIHSLNVNPVTHNITLAGYMSVGTYSNNGVLITFDPDGNLISNLTKISTVTNIFGGVDRDNTVVGLCYDNAGNMYVTMRYFTQDVFFGFNTGRRAVLYGSVDVDGNSTSFKQIGNFFQVAAPGAQSVTPLAYKTIFLSDTEHLYIITDNRQHLQIDFNTLNYQQTYLTAASALSSYAQPRKNGLTYIFSRQGGPSGSLISVSDTTETTNVSIGTASSELTEGRISDEFNCTVASFGTQQPSNAYGRAYCIGFNPVGSGIAAISSGGVSYSVTYGTFPRVPSGMPTGVFFSSSDTAFTFMGQGTHPAGFPFFINQQTFACPVSDAVSPTWILIPSSGTYDPNP